MSLQPQLGKNVSRSIRKLTREFSKSRLLQKGDSSGYRGKNYRTHAPAGEVLFLANVPDIRGFVKRKEGGLTVGKGHPPCERARKC